jgi:hypothetical protein
MSFLLKMYSVFMGLIYVLLYLGSLCLASGFIVLMFIVIPMWLSLAWWGWVFYEVFTICWFIPCMVNLSPFYDRCFSIVEKNLMPKIKRGFRESSN